MFRIIGDEIEFNQKIIGKLTAPQFDFCRMAAMDRLDGYDPDQTGKDRDEEIGKAIEEAERPLQEEISELEMKIDDLERENAAMQKLLDAIDGGSTCAELIAEAKAEAAKWREIAETNRKAYLDAVKPKARKRRSSPLE